MTTITLLSAVAVTGASALARAPLLAEMVRRDGGPAMLARVGLGHLAPVPAQPFANAQPPAWGGTTDAAVRQLQARIAGNPADPQAYAAYAQLGSLYLQKVRETGDPSFYPRAEAALRASLELAPNNLLAAVGMGGLHLARHEFAEALRWGELARQQAPHSPAVYGVIGDALVELGRYDEAVDAIQQMVDLRPDLPSLSRVSYARELHGDLPGAIEAMQRAIAAGNPRSEATNWARVHLGHLYFLAGDLDAADAAYAATLNYLPDYIHGLAGRAKVAAARGDRRRAIGLYERSQQLVPLPEYAIALGDVYRAAGNTASAARQDRLVRVIAQLQRASGVDVGLEMALFEADRAAGARDTTALEVALATARAQHERRPSNVHASIVLGWALYRAGQAEQALPYARAALRLGTQDPVLAYQAGAIAAAAGQMDEAREYLERALALNPQFSVRYAPEAKRLLAQINR